MRTLVLILALSLTPGCLAAAVGGIAYVVGKGKEADASTKAARLDYVQKRRAAGATDAEILSEIEKTDPDWWKEIQAHGGKSFGIEVNAK